MSVNEPLTRREQYLAHAAGQAMDKPETPLNREEEYLDGICNRLDDLADTSGQEIQSAVNTYLDENGVEIGIRIATNEEFEEVFGFECE